MRRCDGHGASGAGRCDDDVTMSRRCHDVTTALWGPGAAGCDGERLRLGVVGLFVVLGGARARAAACDASLVVVRAFCVLCVSAEASEFLRERRVRSTRV